MAHCARKLADLNREIVSELTDNGRALVVSHGAIVETNAVGCKSDENYSSWGSGCDYCEGVRLYFDGTVCKRVELIRVNRGDG